MAEKCPFCGVVLNLIETMAQWYSCPSCQAEADLDFWQAIHAMKADNERLREALGEIEDLRDIPISLGCIHGCSALKEVQSKARRARKELGRGDGD